MAVLNAYYDKTRTYVLQNLPGLIGVPLPHASLPTSTAWKIVLEKQGFRGEDYSMLGTNNG